MLVPTSGRPLGFVFYNGSEDLLRPQVWPAPVPVQPALDLRHPETNMSASCLKRILFVCLIFLLTSCNLNTENNTGATANPPSTSGSTVSRWAYMFRELFFDAISASSVPDAPSAPVQINAGSAGATGTAEAGSVVLQLSSVSGADSYEIWRHTTDDSSAAVRVASGINDDNHIDPGLGIGAVYYYWSKACNDIGCSDFSGSVMAVTIPAVPVAPSLVADGVFSVSLSWTLSRGATVYRILRGISDDASLAAFVGNVYFNTAYTDVVDSAGTTYYYWLRACNDAGCSGLSPGASVRVPPEAPRLILSGVASANVLRINPHANNFGGAVSIRPGATGVVIGFANIGGGELFADNAVPEPGCAATNLPDGLMVGRSEDGNSCQITGEVFQLHDEIASVLMTTITARNETAVSEIIIEIIIQSSSPPAPGPPALSVVDHTSVVITWTRIAGATYYELYRHTMDDIAGAVLVFANTATINRHTDSGLDADTAYYYWLRVCNGAGCSGLSPGATTTTIVVDADNDGLIEISSLEMLHNIRFNLAGTGYKTSANDKEKTGGCPNTGCFGYELTRSLDFDSNRNGRTWSGNAVDGYRLDSGDHNPAWFPIGGESATSAGWAPVGDNSSDNDSTRFVAVFEGNGHTINNLIVRGEFRYTGLFGVLGAGAVVRNLGLVNALIDGAWASTEDTAYAGILAGRQESGSVVASYATGDINGGEGEEEIGGLIGASAGPVVACYAAGNVRGGAGNDWVGGLVGRQGFGATIAASYATGDVSGGAGNDLVGGLVGRSFGSIIASYATGDTIFEAGLEAAGALLGVRSRGGSITASYGFGANIDAVPGARARGTAGTPLPEGVSGAVALTEANAGNAWNDASHNTLNAWDFGDGTQTPALRYADYDGAGNAFSCNMFPAGSCGTLIDPLGQDLRTPVLSVDDQNTISLSWVAVRGAAHYEIWRHTTNDISAVASAIATAAMGTSYTDTGLSADTSYYYWIAACDSLRCSPVSASVVAVTTVVDSDGDGLIEIHSLQMLNHIRFNLAGTGYKTSADDPEKNGGCPNARCSGYELEQNLDFDSDGDGRTWLGNAVDGYRLDSGDHNAAWFPIDSENATKAGWIPVGDGSSSNSAARFTAIFDGNDYAIANLIVRDDLRYAGLFGVLGRGSVIRNLRLTNILIDNTRASDSGEASSGGLAGWQAQGVIADSYATGDVNGGEGGDNIGGLVGDSRGSITDSYAAVNVSGGDGSDNIGGLVGRQRLGTIADSYAVGHIRGGAGDDSAGGLIGRQNDNAVISASYATGDISGEAGMDDVGGLAGRQDSAVIVASHAAGDISGGTENDTIGGLAGVFFGTIVASYATGDVSGGEGDDSAGGLAGVSISTITTGAVTVGAVAASYATGEISGGAGSDKVGGLLGASLGSSVSTTSVTASYAVGNASGGAGSDSAGGLVGERNSSAIITASYGFGTAAGESVESAGAPPSGAATAAALTATNAGAAWNQATSNTMGAWNFGSSSQIPALNYADYDGAGATFSCDMFPAATLCTTPALISFNQRLLAPVLTADSPSQIALMWTTVAGATHYQIWRHTSDNSSAATQIVASTATGTSAYTDSANLSASTTYHYWLKACDSIRCSDFSPVASATTTAGP